MARRGTRRIPCTDGFNEQLQETYERLVAEGAPREAFVRSLGAGPYFFLGVGATTPPFQQHPSHHLLPLHARSVATCQTGEVLSRCPTATQFGRERYIMMPGRILLQKAWGGILEYIRHLRGGGASHVANTLTPAIFFCRLPRRRRGSWGGQLAPVFPRVGGTCHRIFKVHSRGKRRVSAAEDPEADPGAFSLLGTVTVVEMWHASGAAGCVVLDVRDCSLT